MAKVNVSTTVDMEQQIQQVREKIAATVCSSTWADDCLYRGAKYVPNFRCRCALCEVRFPQRVHPREARESAYSGDCQVMQIHDDPELAEELAALRNERTRVGSVFIGSSRGDRQARGASRKGA